MRIFKEFCEYCWKTDADEIVIVKIFDDEYLVGVPPTEDAPAVFTRRVGSLQVLTKEIKSLVGDKIRVVSYRENGKYSIPDPEKIRMDEALDY